MLNSRVLYVTRLQLGWTQAHFAKVLGVKTTAYHIAENEDQPLNDKAMTIVAALRRVIDAGNKKSVPKPLPRAINWREIRHAIAELDPEGRYVSDA